MKDGSSSQAPQWAGGLRRMLARQLSSPGELSLLESPRLPVKARRGKWKEGIRFESASDPRDGRDRAEPELTIQNLAGLLSFPDEDSLPPVFRGR